MKSKIVYWCDRCGTELYAGDVCYRLEGQCLCTECLLPYAQERFRDALGYV